MVESWRIFGCNILLFFIIIKNIESFENYKTV